MKKKINIFGRKVSVLAIMIALLVIGTASAAVFSNYATLSGTEDVAPQVYVIDSYGTPILTGGDGGLIFNSPAEFTIHNGAANPVTVELITTLTTVNDASEIVSNEGISVTCTGNDVTTPDDLVLVTVPAAVDNVDGETTVIVTLNQAPNVMPGTCTVKVAVEAYPPVV